MRYWDIRSFEKPTPESVEPFERERDELPPLPLLDEREAEEEPRRNENLPMKKPPHRDGLNEKNIVYRFTIRSIATRNGTHSHAGRTHRHRMNRESDAHTPYSGYRWCSHNGLAS